MSPRRSLSSLIILLVLNVVPNASEAGELRRHTSVELLKESAGLDCRRGQVISVSHVSAASTSLICADIPSRLRCSQGSAILSGSSAWSRLLHQSPKCHWSRAANRGACGESNSYLSRMEGPLHKRNSVESANCCQLGGVKLAETCRSIVVGRGSRFKGRRHGGSSFTAVKSIRGLGRGRVLLRLCGLACPRRRPLAKKSRLRDICFPGDAMVETPTGPKAMSQLRIGDRVLSAAPGGSVDFHPVRGFYHADAKRRARFLELQTGSGERIRLSHNHLIYSPRGDCHLSASELVLAEANFRFAARLRLGDCLLVSAGSSRRFRFANITEIREVEAVGVFAPVTSSGTLVVDGVLASAYASLESQSTLHLLSDLLHRFFAASATTDPGIPGPVQLLLSLGRLVAPVLSI